MDITLFDYNDPDIMKILQRIWNETLVNREKALEMYGIMAEKMKADDGNLVVLAQMADKWLDQSNKATDQLVKMAAVMQKLKQARDNTKKQEMIKEEDFFTKVISDFEVMDNNPLKPRTKTPPKTDDNPGN